MGIFRSAFLAFAFLLPSALCAEAILIGERRLEIPRPQGSGLAGKNTLASDKRVQFPEPPGTKQFLVFTLPPASGIGTGVGGGEFRRGLSVQTHRKLLDVSLSLADFQQAIAAIDSLRREDFARAQSGYLGTPDSGRGACVGLSGSKLVPVPSRTELLPVHRRTGRLLSYSLWLGFDRSDTAGDVRPIRRALTTTVLYLKTKMVYLNAYGEGEDLDWTRDASRAWADSILAANPLSAADSADEKRNTHREFSWTRMWIWAVVGALIGGLLGFLPIFSRS